MGPWMRLAETVANREGSTRRMNKVMEELKEREQKRLIEARINKEDALKLRATRILRFGRFAIRVPFANITRYRDQPLPQSYAEKSKQKFLPNTSHYIPGQKHHGVMIPELSNSNLMESKKCYVQRIEDEISDDICDDRHDIGKDQYEFEGDMNLSSSNTTPVSPTINAEDQNIQFFLEPKESNEEGFELVPVGSSTETEKAGNLSLRRYDIYEHRDEDPDKEKNTNVIL